MQNNVILGILGFVLIAIFAMVGYNTFSKDSSSEVSETVEEVGDSVGEVGEEIGDEIDDHTTSPSF